MVTLLLAAGVTVAVDAATKRLVLHAAPTSGWGSKRLGLRPQLSRRGALRFGSALGTPVAELIVAMAVAAFVAAVLLALVDVATAVALGVGIGGAVGNVIDQRARGGVTDFVVVGRWPPFNVADAALVASAVLTPFMALR